MQTNCVFSIVDTVLNVIMKTKELKNRMKYEGENVVSNSLTKSGRVILVPDTKMIINVDHTIICHFEFSV